MHYPSCSKTANKTTDLSMFKHSHVATGHAAGGAAVLAARWPRNMCRQSGRMLRYQAWAPPSGAGPGLEFKRKEGCNWHTGAETGVKPCGLEKERVVALPQAGGPHDLPGLPLHP